MNSCESKRFSIKGIFLFGIMILVLGACSTVKETSGHKAVLKPDGHDSTEYDLVIIDIQFDHWYQINYSPAKDYSNEYYRGKNNMAVETWNQYYRDGRYRNIIDSAIDYQSNTDYGIDVNRKLYWYFKFITEQYHIRLIM